MTTPTHDQVREDVGLYVLGALDDDARSAFEAHLRTCDTCRGDVRELTPVVTALAMVPPQVAPSAGLRDRVLSVSRPSLERDAGPRDPIERRTGGASWGWMAAAAAAIVALALGAHAMRLKARVDDLAARLADTERTLAATRSDMVEARRVIGEAESSMRVVLAPDVARVDLAGQPPAASARGRAYFSRSTGLVFTAANLPALPADRVYQLWVVTPTAPISAGLLQPDASGSTTATTPAPPGSDNPVAFAVTIEPAGGVPAPTGDKVLIGMVGASGS